MKYDNYFYNCSEPYINNISPKLLGDLTEAIELLPKRGTQAEINKDIFWLMTSKGWSYDSLPAGLKPPAPSGLSNSNITSLKDIKSRNIRDLCLTSTTLGASWRSDFGKRFGTQLVQIEAQFGKVESMFKDFCGFKICSYERRLALGIEIVISEPNSYFKHRKASTSGMAYFDIAKQTLPAIDLNCPIWLIGLKE
jgi:hypothetical protein